MKTSQRFELTGRLVADPEIKTGKTNGTEFMTASVAVNYSEKNTTFVNLVAFEKSAEILKQLKKGQLINAVGRIDAEAYLSKDNEPTASVRMVVSEIYGFLDLRLPKDEKTSEGE